MQQHVFSHNPHTEKHMKSDPVFMLALLYLMLVLWHMCSVWSERKIQKEGDWNHGVIILLISITSRANGLQSACEWDSEICCYTSTLLPTSIILLSIFCRRLPLAFVCVCLHWTSPLPSLGMAAVNYNYAKQKSAHTAASSEKCSLCTCLLAAGRSQLFGVWFWSHTCSLLMEFSLLQSRHNLHRSEILVLPHECKLLSGSHPYWSGRVIITPAQSSSTPFIADIPLRTC